LPQGAKVLDLCCGSGEAAAPLLVAGFDVSGLDISARALDLAKSRYPKLKLVQGLAEKPPLQPGTFDAVQLSLALHEFSAPERWAVLEAAKKLLLPGGLLLIVDLHPASPVLLPLQNLFCALFETETATDFLALSLGETLCDQGWQVERKQLLAGGALQRLLCKEQPANL
jgi:demethylmenaquinone methyltransferase/2-methoxy-6-polyprenyl-1,4-benzoquinol methylase